MNKHLDFTIDMETVSLSATAAPMQVAIVPWLRDNDMDPFCNENETEPYVGYVDLRSCVVDGFDFDPSTVKWWSEKSAAAKEAVCKGFPEPVSDVLISALDYIRGNVKKYELDSICLWSQGPDLDIAVLKNLCRKYDIHLEEIVPHTSFRDCRTMILEAAMIEVGRCMKETSTQTFGSIALQKILRDPSFAYTLYTPLPDKYASGSEPHDALHDAVQSSWYTWQALKWLRK